MGGPAPQIGTMRDFTYVLAIVVAILLAYLANLPIKERAATRRRWSEAARAGFVFIAALAAMAAAIALSH